MKHPFSYSIFLLFSVLIPPSCGENASPTLSSVEGGVVSSQSITPPTTNLFVERKNDTLTQGDKIFYFSGANQYYFFYKNPKMIDDVFEDAKGLGLNVIRTWAFCEGRKHDGFCFQPEPGVYDENTFLNLDYTIAKASQTGIKLVLTLANNWGGFDHFGGIDQYLAWVGGGLSHDDFYRNDKVKTLYRNYLNHILNRVNTITNVAYKDDPTILMWELMNEPRADDKQSLYNWIDEMAGYIKSIDSHHLVTSGSEGAYASDFLATHQSKNIDMASLHLYPEWWGLSIAAADEYLREHIRIAREELHKPLFLGEFGLKEKSIRPATYQKWYDILSGGDVNGALFWILSGRQYGDPKNEGTLYPDYDGFSVYYPESTELCPIIQTYSSLVQAKLQNPQISLVTPDTLKPIKGTLSVSVKISTTNPIKGVSYRIDSSPWQSMTEGNEQYTGLFDSSTVDDGSHQLQITVVDIEQRETSKSFAIYVNNMPGKATLFKDPVDSPSGPDFGEIYVADDLDNVYLLVHRNDTPTRPFSSNNYIYIDIDNDPTTGFHGYDHRINFAAAGENPMGYGDIFEWYFWNGTYWSYGHYWQASDNQSPLRGNHKQETLPTGTIAASPNGMMEFSFPKAPPSGQKAGITGLRMYIDGANDKVASEEAPIFHAYSNNQKIVIDGKMTTQDEWNYSPSTTPRQKQRSYSFTGSVP